MSFEKERLEAELQQRIAEITEYDFNINKYASAAKIARMQKTADADEFAGQLDSLIMSETKQKTRSEVMRLAVLQLLVDIPN